MLDDRDRQYILDLVRELGRQIGEKLEDIIRTLEGHRTIRDKIAEIQPSHEPCIYRQGHGYRVKIRNRSYGTFQTIEEAIARRDEVRASLIQERGSSDETTSP